MWLSRVAFARKSGLLVNKAVSAIGTNMLLSFFKVRMELLA